MKTRSITKLNLQYAHRFLNYEGEAQYLHGHTGGLTIEVEGDVDARTGFVYPCNSVKRIAWDYLKSFDHALILQKEDPLLPGVLDAYVKREPDDDTLPRMPPALVDLLRRCFRRNSGLRPKTMQEVAAELIEIYEQSTFILYPRQEPATADLQAESMNNRAVSLLDLEKDDEAAAILEELGVERHDPGEGKLDAGSVPAYAEAVAEYVECVRLCRSL